MTVSSRKWTAEIWSTGEDLNVIEGDISLDSSGIPHVTGTLTVEATPSALALDPREWPAVSIGRGTGTTDTVLDVRQVSDEKDGKVTLTLASREGRLQDWAPAADDQTPRQYADDLRQLTQYVLTTVGAGSVGTGPAYPVHPFWEVSNLLTHTSGQVNVTGWTPGTGASGVMRQVMTTPVPPTGHAAVAWTAATGDSNLIASDGSKYPVSVGDWFVFSVLLCSSAATTARAVIQWWTWGGTLLAEQSFGANATASASGFTRLTVIAQAPQGTTHAYPYISTINNTAGRKHYAVDAMFYEGRELVPYFDGNGGYGAPDADAYDYEWGTSPHVSTSTRIPWEERPPDVFIWRAGQTAMDFLAPFLQSQGLRLVCAPDRTWTLRDDDYRVVGLVNLQEGSNISEVRDRHGIDDEWCDAAVVTYRWTPSLFWGHAQPEQTRVDYYQADTQPTKVKHLEVTTPYPGAGRAKNVVTRAQRRYRSLEVTASIGGDIVPDLPARVYTGGVMHQGVISSVRWTSDDRMQITVNNIEET